MSGQQKVLIPTVAQKWDAYFKQVLPDGCGDLQRIEMKRSFFAGAWAMYIIMTTDVPEMDAANAIASMELLRLELQTFAMNVGKSE